MASKTQQRDRDGRYSDALERRCRCGHTKAEHTAERVKWEGRWEQPCLAKDCGCECYSRTR